MWFVGKKGASGFSANATAEQVTKGVDGSGLTAIVTGASSGIGFETTRVLALRGVTVIMAVRNVEIGKKVREIILNETPNANVNVMALDLGSQASVRNFVDEFKSSGLPLHILINNAGILAPPFTLSKEKVELTFATNYLGHFLLTNLLLETMKSTSHEHKIEGRIVNVSSEGHRFAQKGINFDKISEKSSYNPIYAYGLSKMANILHANELARLLKEEGEEITVNSVHPGMISTNMFRNFKIFEVLCNWLLKYFFKTISQGASTTCYVALNPQVKGITGEYFADNDISKPCSPAKDPKLAKKLWEFSLNLTNST